MEKHATLYVIVLLVVLSRAHCQFNDNELYMYFQTANNRIEQKSCRRVELHGVQELNVTYQSGSRSNCACYVTPPTDPSLRTGGVMARRLSDAQLPRVMLSEHEWEHTDVILMTMKSSVLSMATCDVTHQQQLPIRVNFGGDGVTIRCEQLKTDSTYEARCHETTHFFTPDGSQTSVNNDNLLLKLSVVVCVGLLVAVVLNVISTLLVKLVFQYKKSKRNPEYQTYDVTARQNEPASAPAARQQGMYARNQPPMDRQQTVLSHSYESIRDDNDDTPPPEVTDATGSFIVTVPDDHERVGSALFYAQKPSNLRINDVAVYGTAGPSPHSSSYVPMTSSRDDYSSMHIRNSDLDALVLPAETCDDFKPIGARKNSAVYSYAYDSRENIKAQNWPRKFSAESLDSAAALLLRQNPRFRDLAKGMDSAASFDSGYAERVAMTPRDDDGYQTPSRQSPSERETTKLIDSLNSSDYIDVQGIEASGQATDVKRRSDDKNCNTRDTDTPKRDSVDDENCASKTDHDYENIFEEDEDQNSERTPFAPARRTSHDQHAPVVTAQQETPGYISLH